MGIIFNIDAEEGIIYAIAEGKIGPEEVQAYRNYIRADAKFRSGLVEIVEYRLSNIQITDEETKFLASARNKDLSRKLAIVVAAGSQERGALLFSQLVEEIPVKIFTDLGSAKKWVTSD